MVSAFFDAERMIGVGAGEGGRMCSSGFTRARRSVPDSLASIKRERLDKKKKKEKKRKGME